MKLTAKQEKFCQEIALNNKTQADAYRLAYNIKKMTDKTLWENASRLANDSKVSTRIAELKAEVHQEVMSALRYDREAHFKELELCRQLAMTPRGDNGNINENAVIKATELKGKVCGLYTQEAEVQIGTKGITVKIITNG